MTGPQRLTGRIRVGLPPAEAFRLFTARGEQDWVPGWHPVFPVETPDDTEPGTVFTTSAHGAAPTVWVVTGRQPGRLISYTRVTPGDRAGTVTVELRPTGAGDSEVEVTYELTPLSEQASAELRDFAEGYPAYLRSWRDAITAWRA